MSKRRSLKERAIETGLPVELLQEVQQFDDATPENVKHKHTVNWGRKLHESRNGNGEISEAQRLERGQVFVRQLTRQERLIAKQLVAEAAIRAEKRAIKLESAQPKPQALDRNGDISDPV